MNLEEANHWAAKFTYKPNTTIEFVMGRDSKPRIHIYVSVPNVDEAHHEPIDLTFHEPIHLEAVKDPEQLVAMVWQSVLNWEAHEASEWFRVNGNRYHDPHSRSEREDTYFSMFMDVSWINPDKHEIVMPEKIRRRTF